MFPCPPKDEEEAIELALEESQPRGFVGNGGIGKLIGVSPVNGMELSIECGEGEAEGEFDLKIEVSEL